MPEAAEYNEAGMYLSGPDDRYRVPDALSVTPFSLRRVLIVGSCFGEILGSYLSDMAPGAACDTILFNHAGALPPAPPAPAAEYDCQVILLPLREIMQEPLVMRLRAEDAEAYQASFAESVRRLRYMLDGALGFHRQDGMLTFVATFLVPQQNGFGRLMPRRDFRNPAFYVEELNLRLIEAVDALPNCYLLDLDGISANFGRRYVQDDATWLFNHGTVMDDWDFQHDARRIEPAVRASSIDRTQPRLFARAMWREVTAMVRTVRQIDQVKLVAVDLDDTLWRGVVAEDGLSNPALVEGWPIALVEALLVLRRRGILLAIVSKNSASVVEAAWDRIFGGRLALEDFAVRLINWDGKAQNIGLLCRQLNLLPKNVVFIDDNPVERAAVKAAFPDIRVLGANPLLTRRILLWAPETQVATLTAESARRSEMVQAQLAREEVRETMSRADFLAALCLAVHCFRLDGVGDEQFPRALELVNKSNQFNTTGERWTREQAEAGFAQGTDWFVFQVTDRFTEYGLVGVAIVRGSTVVQFVMSCRVVGMEAELAMLAHVAAALGAPGTPVHAVLTETPANLLARDLFPRCGFASVADGFVLDGRQVPVPPHIRLLPDHRVAGWRRLVRGSVRRTRQALSL